MLKDLLFGNFQQDTEPLDSLELLIPPIGWLMVKLRNGSSVKFGDVQKLDQKS